MSGCARLAVLVAAMASSGAKAGAVDPPEARLAVGGKPLLSIVTARTASDRVRSAARALRDCLDRIVGASFAIEEGDGRTGIAVGTAADFPELKLDGELSAPDPEHREQYLLRSHERGLHVVGAADLAVEDAVWDLLHRLGYRHFFPGANWEVVPSSPDLRIDVDVNEKPSFPFRSLWYGFGPWEHAREPFAKWKARNRMTPGWTVSSGHAYEAILRHFPKEFEAHPEYLALVGGERKGAKFCVSNPGLRRLVVRYAIETLARKPDSDSISLEPSDGGGWCECGECAALGSVSDRAVTLANDVAAAIADRHPRAWVAMYAYNEHAPAPAIRVHPRVLVSMATAFNRSGKSVEENLEAWRRQGVRQFGIREYYSVFWWDLSLPGGPRPANRTYVPRTVKSFHERGARALSAESSDCWGPAGLGYYVASRVLWDVRQADRLDAIVDDFLDKCFGRAREPMRRFYELIDGMNKPQMSDHLIGSMYRLLWEAGALDPTPAVRARLDDLLLYTQYVDLFQRFRAAPKGEVRQVAWEKLLRFAYRSRSSMMVDVQVLYRNYWQRYGGGVTVPEEALFTVPESGNPWKSSAPFTRAELDGMTEEGLRSRPVTEIREVSFGRDLVPVAALKPPPVAVLTPIGRARKPQTFYTWFDGAPAVLKLTGKSGLLNHRERPGDSKVRLFRLADGNREPVDEAEIPSDKRERPIELRAKQPGLHAVVVTSPGTSAQLNWDPGTVMTLEMSRDAAMDFVGEWTLWFYVPAGTKTVGGYSSGGGRNSAMCDGDGRRTFEFPKEAAYFNVPVPAGQAGRFWRIERHDGMLFLNTVPPYLARTPQELLLPREVMGAR